MIGTLTPIEVRVLGCLIEKDLATPEYYPLSLNALTLACNQKTSREPVMSLEENDVWRAIDSLIDKGLAEAFRDSRVPKYAHNLGPRLNLGRGELALLAVLMLRGPQTIGELKERTARMHSFDGVDSVASALRRLPDGFAVEIARRPGWKESRWAHLLSGEPEFAESPVQPAYVSAPREDRLAQLEEELARLRSEFDEFRRRFD